MNMILLSSLKKILHKHIKRTPINTVYLRGRLSPDEQKFLKEGSLEKKIELRALNRKLDSFKKENRPLVIEIGFGNGGHLLWLARKNPESVVFGIEMYMVGVIKVLRQAARDGLSNVYVSSDDARSVMSKVSDDSANKIYVLFPDPWPKKKHNKRRLLKIDFIKVLISKLVSGGTLTLATDWEDYGVEIREDLERCQREGLVNLIKCEVWERESIYSTTFAKRAIGEDREIFIYTALKK